MEEAELMQQTIRAKIYGDSLMKGTVIDCAYRYHATINAYLDKLYQRFHIEADNRARFGITIDKGHSLLRQDIEAGMDCDFALIEFGGNDCNFRWNEISVDPHRDHQPLTDFDHFRETCKAMIEEVRQAGVNPVTMTLPPIDAERYLSFLTRNGNDRNRILQWLGDVQQIFRTHERYSNEVARVARETNTPLVDVRSRFLKENDYRQLLCIDGVHPNENGYRVISDAFAEFMATVLPAYGVAAGA